MLCVIGVLDEAAEEKLEKLRRPASAVYDVNTPLHGHVTFATYIGEDEIRFVQECRKLLEGVSSFTVEYRKIEVFENTTNIAAIPERNDNLISLHRKITAAFSSGLDQWTATDCWNPHTTLVTGPDHDPHSLCRQMAEAFVPFSAVISKIEFSRVLDDGYDIIDHIDLAGKGYQKKS